MTPYLPPGPSDDDSPLRDSNQVLQSGLTGNRRPSWPDTRHSVLAMDYHLHEIWSKYTKAPDPLPSSNSLYGACSAFTKHVLQPSHIILSNGGFTLHPELAEPLLEVIPAINYLLRHATHYRGPPTPFVGQTEIQVLTAGHSRATQNQIVFNWVVLLDQLYAAMCEMKRLCLGNPSSPSHLSWIPHILASLPPSLRVKLPERVLGVVRDHGFTRTKERCAFPTVCCRCQGASVLVSICKHRREDRALTASPLPFRSCACSDSNGFRHSRGPAHDREPGARCPHHGPLCVYALAAC